MSKVSALISNVYQKCLPLAEKYHVELNIELNDNPETQADTELLQTAVEKYIESALQRAKQGGTSEVKLCVKNGKIYISDTGTVLSKIVCKKLSSDRIKVKSRVGFGTEICIDLTPRS